MALAGEINNNQTQLANALRLANSGVVPMFVVWGNELHYNSLIAPLLGLQTDSISVVKLDGDLEWIEKQIDRQELQQKGIIHCACGPKEKRFPLTATAITDEGGMRGYFGVARVSENGHGTRQDLVGEQIDTEVRLRTNELEEQKRFVSAILDASFHVIYALKAIRDEEGKIEDFSYLFINHIGAASIGIAPAQIVGSRMLKLLPENRNNGFFDLFCRALESGKSLQDETFFESELFSGWFSYFVNFMDEETLVVTAQDVTQQKRATLEVERQKHRLDMVIENSPTALAFCESIRDHSGRIVDFRIRIANQKAAELTGFTHEEFLTKTLNEIHRINNATGITEMYIGVVETGVPLDFEFYLERQNLWFRVYIVKIQDGFLSVYNDITTIKDLHFEQEKLVEELRRTNSNLQEFAYAASHDLKEPIRKMYFFADHLKSTLVSKLSPEEKHTFERMTLAAKRMGSLIDDLLSYSQVTLGRIENHAIELTELIQLVLVDLDVEIEQRHAKVLVGPLPRVRGHDRQMQQAFLNLLANALKYSKPDVPPLIEIYSDTFPGPGVVINNGLANSEGLYHRIIVKDNGIGFEQDDAEKIFQVFTRLHGNNIVKGTGVGLSIVRKIIENHHGTIHAGSTPGIGTSFIIYLPVID